MVNEIRTIYPRGLNKGFNPELDMKHVKKAEVNIGQIVENITMKTVVRIF